MIKKKKKMTKMRINTTNLITIYDDDIHDDNLHNDDDE